MSPETTKPTAATVGSAEELAGTPTAEVYTDAVSDQDWETAVLSVVKIAGVDSPRGERARRAVHMLCGQPFVPTPVWTVAQAIAWSACGVIYASERATRAQSAKPLREVLDLVARITRDLRRAA